MSKLIYVLLFLLAIGWAGSAPAAPITGADIVEIDGTQWAQVDLFTNLSWHEINTVCPSGVCIDGGTLNGHTMTDWIWASATDFNVMFNMYLTTAGVSESYLLGPDTDYYSEYSSSWATAFFDQWRPTDISPGYADIIWGSFNNLKPGGCCGIELLSLAGVFDRYDESELDSVYSDYLSPIGPGRPNTGAWFYRSNSPQIPVPATLTLLGLGLAVLVFSRRKPDLHC